MTDPHRAKIFRNYIETKAEILLGNLHWYERVFPIESIITEMIRRAEITDIKFKNGRWANFSREERVQYLKDIGENVPDEQVMS